MWTVIASTWAKTAYLQRRKKTALIRHQNRLWKRMQCHIEKTPALKSYAHKNLDEFPIVTASQVRENFTDWNVLGLDYDTAFDAARDAERGGAGFTGNGICAGFSTGTSGGAESRRGVFLTNSKERAIYIGQSLAKLMTLRNILRGQRIALFLRANSRLYEDVGKSGRIVFQYFSITGTPEENFDKLRDFSPTTIIAPASLYASLARYVDDNSQLRPISIGHLFYGAEPFGPEERKAVAQIFGTRLRAIYQATEGFLASECRHGTLHFNEDSLNIELAPIPRTPCFQPIVTDLRRQSQMIVRLKMDDLIVPVETPCPCRFGGMAIEPIMGRVSDIWSFGDVKLTPYDLVPVLERAAGVYEDWQVSASKLSINIRALNQETANSLADAIDFHFGALANLPPIRIEVTSKIGAYPKRRRIVWVDV